MRLHQGHAYCKQTSLYKVLGFLNNTRVWLIDPLGEQLGLHTSNIKRMRGVPTHTQNSSFYNGLVLSFHIYCKKRCIYVYMCVWNHSMKPLLYVGRSCCRPPWSGAGHAPTCLPGIASTGSCVSSGNTGRPHLLLGGLLTALGPGEADRLHIQLRPLWVRPDHCNVKALVQRKRCGTTAKNGWMYWRWNNPHDSPWLPSISLTWQSLTIFLVSLYKWTIAQT